MILQEDGGSPVSNYIVEKCDTRTGKWEPVSKFIRSTKYEVMGLDEGHEYKFRVKNLDYNTGEFTDIFHGEYTVKIFKVIPNTNSMI